MTAARRVGLLFPDAPAISNIVRLSQRAEAVDCGHYLPEELPDETADKLIQFLPA